MFGNKNKENTPGEDSLYTLTDTDKKKKKTGSLEKTEGKKEKFIKLFKRDRKEEETISLYEPEMEFVTEEELKKEQEAAQKAKMSEVKQMNQEDTKAQSNTSSGALGGRYLKFGNFFKKKNGPIPETAKDNTQKNLFHDEPILYDGEEKKGLRKFSKKKIGIFTGAAVIVLGAASYFLITHLGGSVDGTAYVESVSDIMGYGSGNGMNNRYTGEVEPQDSWKIKLQSDLSVDECFVQVGDQVKEGDKLFSYNTEEMQLAKERAELEVESLKNENAQLEKDIKSYQSDLNSASTREKIELQTEILTAQTTIKKNEYSIDSAKDEIEDLEKNIKDATVTSKMDGVVQVINEEVGLSSGADSDDEEDYSDYSDGDEESIYMTIVAVGDYRVKGSVSETNVWSLSEGDPVIVRSRVDENAKWTGSISSVNTDETEDSDENSDEMDYMDGTSGESASTYNFYVELDSDEGLMMGQHVLIEQDFGQDEEREGIWLPSAYLKIDEDKYFVWVSNKRDRLELREVTVGEYDEDLDSYEITDGLEMDDCIASDTGSLQENMKTTTDISEVDSTDEYYESETSDDEIYDSGEDAYYDDESSDDDIYYDESYDDVDFGDDVELIDEGFDPAEFE